MVKQEALPSHDGRQGERGSVVNIASQLGVVGRPNARGFSLGWRGEGEKANLMICSGVLCE